MPHENKKINVSKNKSVVLPLIIFSNLFPLYGVIIYNWTIFSVVYIYWIELLIISSFQLLKIIVAQGDKEATFFSKLVIAFQFFIMRTALFFFYLIFILVFLGFLASAKEDSMKMLEVIFLRESFYKITLLSFFLYNFLEFIIQFILNEKYKKTIPKDNFIILDSHILVVHVVVVLGTFLYKGVTDFLHMNHKSAMIVCVSLFVLVKIIADVSKQNYGNNTGQQQNEPGKFI